MGSGPESVARWAHLIRQLPAVLDAEILRAEMDTIWDQMNVAEKDGDTDRYVDLAERHVRVTAAHLIPLRRVAVELGDQEWVTRCDRQLAIYDKVIRHLDQLDVEEEGLG